MGRAFTDIIRAIAETEGHLATTGYYTVFLSYPIPREDERKNYLGKDCPPILVNEIMPFIIEFLLACPNELSIMHGILPSNSLSGLTNYAANKRHTTHRIVKKFKQRPGYNKILKYILFKDQ